MPQKRLELTKTDLQSALEADPWITLTQLSLKFGCGKNTLARELKRHGLRTKGWAGRKHTANTRAKIGSERRIRGCAKGDNNPNFGAKIRPWLEGDEHPFRKWHRNHPEFGDNQKGDRNPIHKVSHLYSDPEYVTRITSGIRAHSSRKKGRTYEETYGEEKADEYRRRLREASPKRLAKFHRKTTWIELAVRQLLIELGVESDEQVGMGFHTVDFYIPYHSLVIQADGDYWHGNPEVFQALTKRQLTQKRMDHSCDTYLRNQGVTVLRLWESELRLDLDGCRSKIRSLLKENQNV